MNLAKGDVYKVDNEFEIEIVNFAKDEELLDRVIFKQGRKLYAIKLATFFKHVQSGHFVKEEIV